MHRTMGIVSTIFVCLAGSAMAAPQPTRGRELAKVKATLMSADYRADLAQLARVRDELSAWPEDRDLAYLARYWSGFASWRIAINGANRGMKPHELTTNLQKAAAEFYASIRLRSDFADAYAAAAMVNSWLGSFSCDSDPDTTSLRERLALSRTLFARANALDPDNPRVLWAKGAFLLYGPQSLGGAPSAIEVYRHMLVEADRRGVDATSPLPDWGKVEALMSLAYAHFSKATPDLAAAKRAATAALELQPEWSYVRDTLLKQIDERTRSGQNR